MHFGVFNIFQDKLVFIFPSFGEAWFSFLLLQVLCQTVVNRSSSNYYLLFSYTHKQMD